MADDIPAYPFYQPPPFQYDQPTIYSPPPQVVGTKPKPELVCDYCGEEILEDEECMNLLYGVAGPGKKSGRRMVLPSDDIPEGDTNLHIHCISGFIEDSLPEAADEIRQNFNFEDAEEPEEMFCSNCDAKIEDYNAG